MVKKSAGLLMFRHRQGSVEVFLVHPGGPFWAKKDEGAWSIPKREYDPGEDPLDAAKREFQEETGFSPGGEFLPLAPRKQPSGKIISAWALEGDCEHVGFCWKRHALNSLEFLFITNHKRTRIIGLKQDVA